MGEKAKIFGLSVGAFVGLIAVIFILGLAGLGYKAFFAPKHAAIDRQVFEQTQSYVHGKVQDLAKYKQEYDATQDFTEHQAIKTVINQQFAQFDSNKVVDSNLRNFLVRMRGF